MLCLADAVACDDFATVVGPVLVTLVEILPVVRRIVVDGAEVLGPSVGGTGVLLLQRSVVHEQTMPVIFVPGITASRHPEVKFNVELNSRS